MGPYPFFDWRARVKGVRPLFAIVNFNTDVSNFWEFSGTGFRPVEESNEAFKLGVNYIMYGLTH